MLLSGQKANLNSQNQLISILRSSLFIAIIFFDDLCFDVNLESKVTEIDSIEARSLWIPGIWSQTNI
jgi:predicted AAA+ superfamily ATPase